LPAGVFSALTHNPTSSLTSSIWP